MQRYFSFWLVLTVCLLLVVGAFNFVVDPYGMFRFIDKPRFNSVKPKAGMHGATVKAYQVARVQPRSLILGNSRAEVGFDPMHPAWPAHARPVFNFALPGTATHTSVQSLRQVLANAQEGSMQAPKVIVWGIDFMDFLVDRNVQNQPIKPRKDENRLFNPDSTRYLGHVLQQIRDSAEATFTLGAFLDSIQTVLSQAKPYSEDLTPLGFNPMRDYLKITADEGYWAVFRQRDLENMKAYLRRPKDVFGSTGRSSPALDDLREVIRLCEQHDIELNVVIYPYHAHLLEIIRISGHWPALEAWKREVVHIVVTESLVRGNKSISLWDFSQFNELTEEAVPAKADRQTEMHWYWEAGHFKKELGDLVLNTVLDHSGAWKGFGVLLNPENLEEQIALGRAQEADYRHRYSQDVEQLERMAKEIVSRQQKR